MEVKLSDLLGNYDRQANRPTDRPTDRLQTDQRTADLRAHREVPLPIMAHNNVHCTDKPLTEFYTTGDIRGIMGHPLHYTLPQ